jgi:catechol 2,3-dioxygenase-like lactoylglutathione lyase family enzyme
MTSIKILSTHHTSFTVSNVERTKAMFMDGFGFSQVSTSKASGPVAEDVTGVKGASMKFAMLKAPDGHLVELVEYESPADKKKMMARPCDTGFTHLAFRIEDMESAVAAAERVGLVPYNKVYGIGESEDPNLKVVYLKDEDGLSIELMEWPD